MGNAFRLLHNMVKLFHPVQTLGVSSNENDKDDKEDDESDIDSP